MSGAMRRCQATRSENFWRQRSAATANEPLGCTREMCLAACIHRSKQFANFDEFRQFLDSSVCVFVILDAIFVPWFLDQLDQSTLRFQASVTTVFVWFLASQFLDVGGAVQLHAPPSYEHLRSTIEATRNTTGPKR